MKNNLKILLIEDNSGDAELFREMVSACEGDCELNVAERLASGLKMLAENRYDAVCLDLGLPDSTGIDTLRRFQDSQPNVPVIVLTGLTDRELAAKAISLGAQDYLLKGRFESEVLYRSILYSIERKRNEVAVREQKEMGDALNRINALIFSTLDFGEIMRRIVRETAGAAKADAAVIFMAEGNFWTARYEYSFSEIMGKHLREDDLKFSRASKRSAAILNELPPTYPYFNVLAGQYGVRGVLDAPLMAGDEVIGNFSLYSRSSGQAFSEVTVDFIEKVSASVAIAIENARLYAALKESEHVSRSRLSQLETIYSSAPVGLCFIDADLRFVNVNERLAEMNGLPPDKHIGRTVREVLPQLADVVEPHLKLAIEAGKPTENVEFTGIRKKGSGPERCWLGSYYPVRDAAGRIIGVNAVVQEITARKQMEEEIKHLANHDALTGLPNRRLFVELIGIELAAAQRQGSRLAVFFLDLDRFKNINDTLGHEAGDDLLRQVAAGLRSAVRKSDTVARIGGDEFNLIVSDISDAGDVVDIARKVVGYFDRKFVIAGQELHVTASLGVSIFPDDSTDVDTLLRYADIAMYHAKEQGRNNYQFYNPEINTRSLERMQLENWLDQSVDRGELFVHYQPQVDISTGRIVCAEALVRWLHPEMGLIDPARFIPLAEETGFITAIDEWVLRSVCEQARAWHDAGTNVCVTVNLSARLFENPDLVATVSRILQETGMEPSHLALEITESMAMSNVARTAVRLKELAGMGIHISIDDFGTGYSSLNYLKRLPIERLKIDKSFVQDIPTDADDRTIITAVTAMAHNMRLKVIAEGVETEEQLSFLRSAGCDEMQGFLFSRPLSADKFRELVTNGKR